MPRLHLRVYMRPSRRDVSRRPAPEEGDHACDQASPRLSSEFLTVLLCGEYHRASASHSAPSTPVRGTCAHRRPTNVRSHGLASPHSHRHGNAPPLTHSETFAPTLKVFTPL